MSLLNLQGKGEYSMEYKCYQNARTETEEAAVRAYEDKNQPADAKAAKKKGGRRR